MFFIELAWVLDHRFSPFRHIKKGQLKPAKAQHRNAPLALRIGAAERLPHEA